MTELEKKGLSVGDRIKGVRKKKNITQVELAESIGITQSHLSQIENDHRNPSITTLEKICKELDIPISGLLLLSLQDEHIRPDKREKFKEIRPLIEELLLE